MSRYIYGWLIQIADEDRSYSVLVQGEHHHESAVKHAERLTKGKAVGWLRVQAGVAGPRHLIKED